jgi:hypothetical protein
MTAIQGSSFDLPCSLSETPHSHYECLVRFVRAVVSAVLSGRRFAVREGFALRTAHTTAARHDERLA